MPQLLIVDDQAADRELLLEQLAELPVRCRAVGSGAEAVASLAEGPPVALVLLDVRMPRMDGYATAERIHARPASRRTPIIFLTGVPTESDQVFRGYQAGAVDFVSKGLPSHILRSKIAVFLELWSWEQDLRRRARERVYLMAAELCHEINNPLSFVVSNLDFLRLELAELAASMGEPEETLRESVEEMQRAASEATHGAKRLGDLVRQHLGQGTAPGRKQRPRLS